MFFVCFPCKSFPFGVSKLITEYCDSRKLHIHNSDEHDYKCFPTTCDHCPHYTCDLCVARPLSVQLVLLERMQRNRIPDSSPQLFTLLKENRCKYRYGFNSRTQCSCTNCRLAIQCKGVVDAACAHTVHTGEYLCPCANCLFRYLPEPVPEKPSLPPASLPVKLSDKCPPRVPKMQRKKNGKKNGTRNKRNLTLVLESQRDLPVS